MRRYPYCECNGDASLVIVFGDTVRLDILKRLVVVVEQIKAEEIKGIVDIVPAYVSITVSIDLDVTDTTTVSTQLESMLHDFKLPEVVDVPDYPIIEIPVCYDPSLGIDIESLAEYCALSVDDVISLHTKPVYTVYMLGFMPGFLYLGGLDARLHMPRKSVPRTHIPKGAVAIGGMQTGVYPFAGPGGWQIIGCTPIVMFDSQRQAPAIARPLQGIQFVSVDLAQFKSLQSKYS